MAVLPSEYRLNRVMRLAQCLKIQVNKQDFASILQPYRLCRSFECPEVTFHLFHCICAVSDGHFFGHWQTLQNSFLQSFDGWLVVALHQNPFVPKLLDCTRNKCNCTLRCLGIQASQEVCTSLFFCFSLWFHFFTQESNKRARFLAQSHPLGPPSAVCAAALHLTLLHSACTTTYTARVQVTRALHAPPC